jgi:hypothetical protein
METEQTEPHFAGLGAVLAYEHRTHGAEHLEQVLAALVESGEQRREFVERAACQLKALHHTAAELVLEAALECPSMCDVDAFCPYMKPPYVGGRGNENNIICWQRAEERRAEKIRRECRELLRKAGVDPGWLNGKPHQ